MIQGKMKIFYDESKEELQKRINDFIVTVKVHFVTHCETVEDISVITVWYSD